MMSRRVLAGQVLSGAGRSANGRGKEWLERVAETFGGSVAPLGASTTWVVTQARPARKQIDRLKATSPSLRESTLEEFVVEVCPGAEIVVEALRTDSGRAWLGEIRGLYLGSFDLSGMTFRGRLENLHATIDNANLSGIEGAGSVYLKGTSANFEGADLSGASGWWTLKDSNLRRTRLCMLNLSNGRFTGCDFREARLSGQLCNLKFVNCDFRDAEFGGGSFDGGVHFEDCDFRGASFSGVDTFRAVRMQNCNLDGVDLGAVQAPRVLRGCSLRGARLRLVALVCLDDADCTDADFRGSDLVGFDLRTTVLTNACFEGCDLTTCLRELPLFEDLVLLEELAARRWRGVVLKMPFEVPGHELAIEARLGLGLTSNRRSLVLERATGARRSMEFGSSQELIGALKAFGAQPIWNRSTVEVEGNVRVTLADLGRQQWSQWLGQPINTSEAPVIQQESSDLFDAVLAEEPGAWAVLSDWLTETGDPRGVLIARLLAVSGEERRRLLRYHQVSERQAILGELAGKIRANLSIEMAFVRAIRVGSQVTDKELRLLAAHSCTRLLRKVHASSTANKARGLAALIGRSGVVEVTIENRSDQVVAALSCCPGVVEATLKSPGARALAEVFPNLRTLHLRHAARPNLVGLAPQVLKGYDSVISLRGMDCRNLQEIRWVEIEDPGDLLEAPLRLIQVRNANARMQEVLDVLAKRGVEIR